MAHVYVPADFADSAFVEGVEINDTAVLPIAFMCRGEQGARTLYGFLDALKDNGVALGDPRLGQGNVVYALNDQAFDALVTNEIITRNQATVTSQTYRTFVLS